MIQYMGRRVWENSQTGEALGGVSRKHAPLGRRCGGDVAAAAARTLGTTFGTKKSTVSEEHPSTEQPPVAVIARVKGPAGCPSDKPKLFLFFYYPPADGYFLRHISKVG